MNPCVNNQNVGGAPPSLCSTPPGVLPLNYETLLRMRDASMMQESMERHKLMMNYMMNSGISPFPVSNNMFPLFPHGIPPLNPVPTATFDVNQFSQQIVKVVKESIASNVQMRDSPNDFGELNTSTASVRSNDRISARAGTAAPCGKPTTNLTPYYSNGAPSIPDQAISQLFSTDNGKTFDNSLKIGRNTLNGYAPPQPSPDQIAAALYTLHCAQAASMAFNDSLSTCGE